MKTNLRFIFQFSVIACLKTYLKNQNINFIIFIMFYIVFHMNIYGQNIRFNHISIEQGLSQSSIYCITQDNKGFMWFGTEGGLNKYDGYNFTIYSFDLNNPNTLSNSFINTIYNDFSGIFWIGTERGLNQFDLGKDQITRYINDPNNPNSLSNDRVHSICRDGAGDLWIGTENGLNKLIPGEDLNKFIRYQHNPSDAISLSHNSIRFIYKDKSDVLWVATYGGGLNKVIPADTQGSPPTFINYKHNPKDPTSLSDNYVLSIFEDKSGILWIGTENGGLNQFDRKNEKFINYKNNPKNHKSISDNHIHVIYEDRAGIFWIGTNNGGLNIFDRETKTFTSYKTNPDDPYCLSSNRVQSIFEDHTGAIWIGNYGGERGIDIYNRETQKFTHYQNEPNNPNSLSYDDVRPIYEDHKGVLWIGTDGGGLNRFDRIKNEYKSYRNNPNDTCSLSDNRVYAICEDLKNVLWIGTHGGGLNKFVPGVKDDSKPTFIRYFHDPNNKNSLSDNRIRIVREDNLGELWIGTNGGGLNRFDLQRKKFTHFKFDPKNPYSLSNNRIYSLIVDRSNVLWIGTFGGGLNRFAQQREKFIRYQNIPGDPNSLSNNFILAIFEDKFGTLWIGTYGGGLSKFDRETEKFTHYTKKDGFWDEVIYDIIGDDDGDIWISTNRGLTRFNPETLTFKNFDMKDGLQSNEFNTGSGFKSRNGEMFFGGINGFNSFFPDRIRDNPYIPKIVITNFMISNKPVPIGKMENGRTILKESITETEEIELLYTDKVLSFEFAALHYDAPDKNMYAYMFEGFEEDWNYVGNRRFVSYTGLPPGDYIFKVKGSNNDGVWNEEGISLKIIITPPFWKTTWFILLAAIFMGTCLYTAHRLRVRSIIARSQ